jgi:HK97 gp10 family phage protein
VRATVRLNRFPQLPGEARQAVGRAFAREAPGVLVDMQNRTPVSEEQHRHLVETETAVGDEDGLTLRAGAGLPDARALYVHQGTHRMAARPFMRSALEESLTDIEQAIADELRAGLR